jgi:hypothetical protein
VVDEKQNKDSWNLGDLGFADLTGASDEAFFVLLALVAGGFAIYGLFLAGQWAYRAWLSPATLAGGR